MTVNLHTHTSRCGHATGCEKDYIEKAIAGGIRVMGFSDHIPFVFPDGQESPFRIPMKAAQNYIDTLHSLKEEYRNEITIHIGFEMEYYPLYFKDMLKIATDMGAEYLLLGQHYIKNEDKDLAPRPSKPTTDKENLICYADTVIEAMETGVFSYFAHPDVFNFFGDDKIYTEHMKRICEASNRCGVPLEINFLGLRTGRQYPNRRFWEIAGECGCEAVFGLDAHAVKEAAPDKVALTAAEYLVRENGLRYVPYPDLVDPLTKKRTPTQEEK